MKIAWRYFRAARKSLARFTASVAVAGIAAGVAALILANALARGFAAEMQDKILANTPHVAIFSTNEAAISDWQKIVEKIELLENVAKVAPTAYENSLIIGASETSYAMLKVQDESDLKGSQIAVGWRLAEKLNLPIGDQAELSTIENNAPTRVTISEIFQTGIYDYDATWILVAPETFAYLQKQKTFTPIVLDVSVTNIYRADETANLIGKILGGDYKIVAWQEANQPLFAALSLERRIAVSIIGLIIFVAALNITTTLALLVNERRLDIAVLRTCGASGKSLISIFLLEGFFLACAGIFFGVIAGLIGCFVANRFKLISLSAEVYSLNQITLAPTLSNVLLIICAAFLLCAAAAFYPAWRAAQIKPLENLRRQ